MKQFALRRGEITPGWYAVRDFYGTGSPEIWQLLERAGFDIIRSGGYTYTQISRDTLEKFTGIVGKNAIRVKDIEVNRTINIAIAKAAILRYPGSFIEGSFSHKEILDLLHKQNYECNGCGTLIHCKFTIDHIQPTSRGGSNHITNIQLLCGPCNFSKSDRTMAEWVVLSTRCSFRWSNGLAPPHGSTRDDRYVSLQDLVFSEYSHNIDEEYKVRAPYFGRRKRIN